MRFGEAELSAPKGSQAWIPIAAGRAPGREREGARAAVLSIRPWDEFKSVKYATLEHMLRACHLPSFSPRALPPRNLDTKGVLDKDKQVEMKTL